MEITIYKSEFTKVIDFLKKDIAGLRTGRTSTAMAEDLLVEAYGSKQPIKALASINAPDSKTVTIEPWDKSLLAFIEKAVRESSLGINPVNNGKTIILPMPTLTSERRQELIKVLRQKLENARVSIRQTREQAKEMIETAEQDKKIGEDEKFRLLEKLDEMVREYNEQVKATGEKKEQEINTV